METKAKLMLGSISFLKPDMKFFEKRVEYHEQQLRYLEGLGAEIPYYRVEIFWDGATEEALSTTMSLHSIKVNAPCPPGKSRNLLLKELYASGYDYLICCDDDQVFLPGNEGYEFLKHLPVTLAQEGALITFQNETWITKAKERQMHLLKANPKLAGKQVLEKALCTGNMQISCIPNLVKYGRAPIFFDEVTMAQEGEIPEDARFQVDWLLAKNPVYHCVTLYNVALDNYVKSSIYKSGRFRYMTNKTRIDVLDAYIRAQVPTRPEITNLETLSKYRNTARDVVYVDVTT